MTSTRDERSAWGLELRRLSKWVYAMKEDVQSFCESEVAWVVQDAVNVFCGV